MARSGSIFQSLRARTEHEDEEAPLVSQAVVYQPTYQNRLRLIGRHLERTGSQAFTILEVAGGMLVRARMASNVSLDLMEFPDSLFPELFDQMQNDPPKRFTDLQMKSALAPTGYEDVLSALGLHFDDILARMVLVTECQEFLFVQGQRARNHTSYSGYSAFEEMYAAEDVDSLLNATDTRLGD